VFGNCQELGWYREASSLFGRGFFFTIENKEAFMSLLSDFLGTEEFSLMDSPMFQELIKNIKNNLTYSANNKFD
jgi:hypothetical protein